MFHHDIESFLWLFLWILSYRVDGFWNVDPEETGTPFEGPGGTHSDPVRFWGLFEGNTNARRRLVTNQGCTLDWVKALPNGNRTLSGPLLTAWAAYRRVLVTAAKSNSPSSPPLEATIELVNAVYWLFRAGLSSHSKLIQNPRDGKGRLVEIVEDKLEDNEHVTDGECHVDSGT